MDSAGIKKKPFKPSASGNCAGNLLLQEKINESRRNHETKVTEQPNKVRNKKLSKTKMEPAKYLMISKSLEYCRLFLEVIGLVTTVE